MKKINLSTINWISCSFTLLGLVKCTKNDSTESINLNQAISSNKKMANEDLVSRSTLNKLAKSIALSIKNTDFADFVNTELNNEWGGDFQLLIPDKFYNKIRNEKSFGQYLEDKNLDPIAEAELFSSRKLRLLATENTYVKIKNQGVENVLVIIEAENPKQDKILEAYTITGKKIQIPAYEEPKNPVFVIGNCEVCTEEIAIKLKDNPKPNQASHRRTNGYGEYITKIRLPKVSLVEIWTQGRPEMKLLVVAYELQYFSPRVVKETNLPNYSRGAWESGLNFDTDPSYTPGFHMFNWYFNNSNGYIQTHGYSYFLQLWEWDDDGSVVNITYSVKSSENQTVSLVYSGIKSGDDKVDGQEINFQDSTPRVLNNGTVIYTINNIMN